MKLGCHINLGEKQEKKFHLYKFINETRLSYKSIRKKEKKILLHRFINDSTLSYKSSRKKEKKFFYIDL